MALGAIAVVPLLTKAGGSQLNGGSSASDPFFFEEVTVVGDGAYPTGGSIGLDTGYQALDNAHTYRTIVGIVGIDTAGYVVAWDSTNKKLKFYSAPNTEVANATNLSGTTFHLLLICR